jgi:hypothetical protein
MFFNVLLLAAFLQVGVHTIAAAIRRAGGPIVGLDYEMLEEASTGGVDKFLGIPYAQPRLAISVFAALVPRFHCLVPRL